MTYSTFTPLQYFAYGPRGPELNLENCVSDDPGGTSGHVVQVRAIAALLRGMYTTHVYMVTIYPMLFRCVT